MQMFCGIAECWRKKDLSIFAKFITNFNKKLLKFYRIFIYFGICPITTSRISIDTQVASFKHHKYMLNSTECFFKMLTGIMVLLHSSKKGIRTESEESFFLGEPHAYQFSFPEGSFLVQLM